MPNARQGTKPKAQSKAKGWKPKDGSHAQKKGAAKTAVKKRAANQRAAAETAAKRVSRRGVTPDW